MVLYTVKETIFVSSFSSTDWLPIYRRFSRGYRGVRCLNQSYCRILIPPTRLVGSHRRAQSGVRTIKHFRVISREFSSSVFVGWQAWQRKVAKNIFFLLLQRLSGRMKDSKRNKNKTNNRFRNSKAFEYCKVHLLTWWSAGRHCVASFKLLFLSHSGSLGCFHKLLLKTSSIEIVLYDVKLNSI